MQPGLAGAQYLRAYNGNFVGPILATGGTSADEWDTANLDPSVHGAQNWVCSDDINLVRDVRAAVANDPYAHSYMFDPLVRGDGGQTSTGLGSIPGPKDSIWDRQLTESAVNTSMLESYCKTGATGASGAIAYPITRDNSCPLISPINAADLPGAAQLTASNIAYRRHLGGASDLYCWGSLKWRNWRAIVAAPRPFNRAQ